MSKRDDQTIDFWVSRTETNVYKKDIDADTPEEALRIAERLGPDFKKGATLFETENRHKMLPDNEAAPKPHQSNDKLLTVREAAVALKVTDGWIYRNWQRHKLGHKLSHRQLRLSAKAIQRFIEMRQAR